VINERGTIGGSVLTDTVNNFEQAALYRGDQVELIPRQTGEVTSFVIGLNDSDTALVLSIDALARRTVVLFSNGQATPLDFGLAPGLTVADPLLFPLGINNQGIVSGTIRFPGDPIKYQGFRFDPRSGETNLLLYPPSPIFPPTPVFQSALGIGINNSARVVGPVFQAFSNLDFIVSSVGVWDHKAGACTRSHRAIVRLVGLRARASRRLL